MCLYRLSIAAVLQCYYYSNFLIWSHVRLNKFVLHCTVRRKTHINVAMKLYGRLESRVDDDTER